MTQAQNKKLVLIVILMISLVFTATAQTKDETHTDIISLISIFINSPYPGYTSTGQADTAGNTYSIAIEDIKTLSQKSNDGNSRLRALKLTGKPVEIKTPGFEPLIYLDIHTDSLNYSSITIRIINEWNRSDLIIYHYKDNEWQPLETTITGNYLEAVTESLSVFAVGAPGGINIHLLADKEVMTGGNAVIAGAAYFNNSTAASGINIEINPSWDNLSGTITDSQGNFQKILKVPQQPGNYTIRVNATSGIQDGENQTTIRVTNTSLFVISTGATIRNTTVSKAEANISFSFPQDAVPVSADLLLSLDSAAGMKVSMNNITIYNSTTNNVTLNLTGYLDSQNDINITTDTSANITYTINQSFHITKTASVTKPDYYSANLIVINDMDYNWNNTDISYHLPDGAYNVSVWENSTNLTGNSIIPGNGGILTIKNSAIGTIYNKTARNFVVNYSLAQLTINMTVSHEEAEKGEIIYVTPDVYYNGSGISTGVWIRIYRDTTLVYNSNVSSGTPFSFSDITAGVYNITATASSNIDGVERNDANRTYIHVKDLLLYLNVKPALSQRQINVTGRAYYTNNTGYEGPIWISSGSDHYSTFSDPSGFFSYTLPGKNPGKYTISANITSGNYTPSASASLDVMDKYFYLLNGTLPVVNGEMTLAPDATLWINSTNITRANLYIFCKTAIRLLYNPLPVAHKIIPANLGGNISGTFKLPLYPYDYLEILGAYLNTTAEDPVDTVKDMAFNLTIDNREINSLIIPHGDLSFEHSDNINGYIPGMLKPGVTQTVRVYNKNTGSNQQYYFTEEIYVDYIGRISSPCDLYIKTNNNFTYANTGNFTNATVDISGLDSANNSIRLNNCRRTSILGYNLTLDKQYSGYTIHNQAESSGRYNITDTVTFIPESNLTSVTVTIPLLERAKDVIVYVNGTDMTYSAVISENLELPLPQVNTAKIINITYWVPILDIIPSVGQQFNRGDIVDISANITYSGENVSDATVFANVTKGGDAIANLSLANIYGGLYSANFTLQPDAALGLYNVTIRAYNSSTEIDNESIAFRVNGLNVTVNAGGPYVVDKNASISGYIKDLENNTNVSGALVNISVWNNTFYNSTATTSTPSGYYNLTRPVDTAGDYNITVAAFNNNIRGIASTTYKVKYNVSVSVLQASYNKNNPVPANLSVYDRSLIPVPGAAVNSVVNISNRYFYYNGTTDLNGMFNFTHSNTSNYGQYNITASISKDNNTGNANTSFRISSLTVTANTAPEYNAGNVVVINGTVYDDETGTKVTGAAVNITINNGSAEISRNTTSSAGNYSVSFMNLSAGVYTAWADVTYTTLSGSAAGGFHIHYNVNTTTNRAIYSIGEAVPINITVSDVNNQPATADISVNIRKPDSGIETISGFAINGSFNTTFTNSSIDGDYTISAGALNNSTSAHGNAMNRSFRASGFFVNASFDRDPVRYRPGETVIISGLMRDTLGAARVADVFISINNSSGIGIANTTLYGMNGSYTWNYTLSNASKAGWYAVNVNAVTPEGVGSSATARFEVVLNIIVSTGTHYNPGDAVNVTVFARNGSVPEDAVINMSVQKFDIWDEFTGTYFDTNKMMATAPDYDSGYYLTLFQNDELVFYTANLTINNTWIGKAVQLNTTSLPSHFILDYEVSTGGTSSQLLARPDIGNTTNYVRLNFRNYLDNAQDGYDVVVNGVSQYVFKESMDNEKIRITIEYNAGTVRFYKNGEQFYQTNFMMPANSAIKLNGYALNPDTGTSAYIKYDNVTLYNLSSPVLSQGTPEGTGGNYSFNFTAGSVGMYRINATSGNSSSFTAFKVSTLDVSSVVYGPYNFNESTLSNNTVVPLIVHGTVQDTETRAGITGADVSVTILKNAIPLTQKVTSSISGNYVISFAGELDNTAVGIFNLSVNVNKSGILASRNNSFNAITINQSWIDPSLDYRVPILLNNESGLAGRWQFNEGTGTNVADSSGNGNTGTLYGASVANPAESWTDGKSGTALQFDGLDDYVQVNPALSLNLSYATYSMWVKVGPWIQQWGGTNVTTALFQGMWANGSAFLITNDPIPAFSARIYVNKTVYDSTTIPIDRNSYHMLTMSFNGTNFRVYLDGTLKYEHSGATGVLDTSVFSNPLIIGAATNGAWRDFSGSIDEVKIYNRALSDSEIADSFNSSNLAHIYNPGIVSFNLALPGGATDSSAALYDIEGNRQTAAILDMGSYLNITFTRTLSAYEGKPLYLYFERPYPVTPHNSALSSLSSPYSVVTGTVEGYRSTITPDRNIYSAGETVVLKSELRNITGDPLVSAITTTIYYPNGTIAQVNYSSTNDSGEAYVNYSIPALKGSFSAVTETIVNGIPRKESTSFSVGNLTVDIDTDKSVYNIFENVKIGVNANDNGNTIAASVTLKISNPDGTKVLEETKNTKSFWLQTTDADFNTASLWNVNVSDGNVVLAKTGSNYYTSGSLTSQVYDSEWATDWGILQWNATTHTSNNITIYTRTSQNNITWSSWVAAANGGEIESSSRYIQYRANLTTTDITRTPTLEDVTLDFGIPAEFNYPLTDSPLGNYTIAVSANKTGNAGFNSTIVELDSFDLSATVGKPVYTSNENITISGVTAYRGANSNAGVNLAIKKDLAINPSFETDLDANSQPDGWIPAWDGIMTRDAAARTGNYTVKVSRSAGNVTEGLWYYPNMYVVSPNTNYTFGMWARTDNFTGGSVRLWASWYNGTTSIATAINAIKTINSQNGWTFIQGSAVSPLNANNVRVHLVSNILGSVWFDDVNIEPPDNTAVYTSGTTSDPAYSFNLSLPGPGSYIAYVNGNYTTNGTLSRTNTTTFTTRILDVTASAGGPYGQGSGNVTISGNVTDNSTKMNIRGAAVDIEIIYPDNSTKKYTNTSNILGYYELIIATPGLAGKYSVNITARDYQGVKGTANTQFNIGLISTLSTEKIYINSGSFQNLTAEAFEDTRIDDLEGTSTSWTYRTGTDGTIRGQSTLNHKSGSKSLKVDYSLAAGNEYMYLESGMGAVNVSNYRIISFWLYIPPPGAFDSVALVLENDPTGLSSDEKIYGQNPVPGWNYYSFNVSTFGNDLSHNHYLTVFIDDNNGTGEVTGTGSLYIDDLKLVKGAPVTGAFVTINITRPDMTINNFSTLSGIVDNGDGTYSLNYTNTDLAGNYTAISNIDTGTYNSTSSTTFGIDGISISSKITGPYVLGNNLTVSGNISSVLKDIAFEGNITFDLAYPDGTMARYNKSGTIPATESYTQTGSSGQSGFNNPSKVNDGSTSTYAYTSSCAGCYIQVTWPDNRTISRIRAYYYSQYWPKSYKIQVLAPDGVTWVDKKTVSGFIASPTTYPTIEDRIPTTITKGVRIYYQTSYYNSYIYIYEMWAYGPEGYSIDGIPLPLPGNYTLNVSAVDSYGISGSAPSLNVPVRYIVSVQFDKKNYELKDHVRAYVRAFNSTGFEPGVQVTSQLVYAANGSIIDTENTTSNSTGVANVSFTLPDELTSYKLITNVSKNGIQGISSDMIATTNLRIWTERGEAQIGVSSWAENSAPQEYRNITIKVAALAISGMRMTGQNLTARIYYPNGTIFGSYVMNESDKIYSTNVLLPGKNVPEGTYDIEIAEYPGLRSNFSVMVWGCAQCHKPNTVTYHYVYHDDPSIAPSTFAINHSHRTLRYDMCGGGGCHSSLDSRCSGCHAFEGSTNAPLKCKACHNSAMNNSQGYLNTTYGADLHANINTKPGGPWYGKSTACESCHGTLNSTNKPGIPQCTNCHPNSSGSGMKTMPGNLNGYSTTLEDFEDVSDIVATSGYRYSTISIVADSNNHGGSYSGKINYGFGPGYGRVYLDKKNLDLTNATRISAWVYGDNSGTTMYLGINNTKSSKVNWHQSAPIIINWTGWKKVSVPIKELSQSALLYITFADTVRIRLESNNELGSSGTIFIDDLKKEAVGSHTQYDEVECGVCHAGRHEIKKAPRCQDCHQNQEHGWPAQDKYAGDNASCMNCHNADASENLINISNISEHAEILESFENISVFTTDLTGFNQSGIYYNGIYEDNGNHSAVLNYTNLGGYLGNSINVTDAYKFKGISVFVKASGDPGTKIAFGVYTTMWYNYSVPMDWDGWKEINILYHNVTVNETISFNASGNPSKIWFGVYEANSTGTVYFDDLRQAVSDDYHQYESWKCADCHTRIKNLHGITDITSAIVDCSLCHNLNEPHYKQFTRVCMDCHFDSRHGEVEDGNFTNYEKASTCLKCHTVPHDFNRTHLETAECNTCHQQRIHGQNYQNVQYNKSLHLDCERCHGKTTEEAPLPVGSGSPRTTILRLSYTYNNETQCLFCHKNPVSAYNIHANDSVNESNQGLVNRVLDNSICSDCHGIKSVLADTDRDELVAADPDREPYAPQIDGHGNVSCYKCHGHRPETLTLNYGSNCAGCHQNMAELTELIPGTLNDSRLTNVTNPGEKALIVHPPQVTGHGNASCSNCHGHVNSNLTYVGSSAIDCANCHRNTSTSYPLIPFREPDSFRSIVTNPGGNPLNVIAPQVLGHGNASCRECHDHTPSYFNGFDFTEGTICESCHQNSSKNISLIENTHPDSKRTEIVDNSTSISIVHSPQVMGHGQTACTVCHSHSAERLVYYGGNNTDCVICHYNESSAATLLQNGSYMVSTQVTPHLDMNCTACHGHTPANMTRIKDCSMCHQDSTFADSLSDTYGKGLNLTGPESNISAVQIPGLQHSTSNIAGRKWNKTTAYWNNNYEACQYCHTISKNFSSHNPLGRIAAIAGNNTANNSLSGSYWCAACHYQGYVSGNVTYNDMVNTFIEMGLPVPPEITGNASYGNYATSNDGVIYYDHGLSDYSDNECTRCHGKANNTKKFMHGVTTGSGGSECLNCHDGRPTGPVDDPDKYPGIVNTSFGKHKNLDTTNGSDILDNNDCVACHYNTSLMDNPEWTTPTRACNDCHLEGNFPAPEIVNHRPGGTNIKTTANCTTCHNNSINTFEYNKNASVSHYVTNRSILHPTVNQTAIPRFGFFTQADSLEYNKECNSCHNPSNSSYGNGTLITKSHTGRGTCNGCHVNGSASDLHNSSLGMPLTTSCKSCHTTYASKYNAPNLTGTPMVDYSTCNGGNCHGTDISNSLDTLARHNADRTYPGTGGSTDTVYLNNNVSLTVTKGTTVEVTARVKDAPGAASRVGGAEYYIDIDPGQGKGIPMSAADGLYDAARGNWENINVTIDTGSLSDGNHTIFVRSVDIGKQWSPSKNATLFVQSLGYINGTATSSGVPLAGAIITTTGANTTTSADGNFSLRVPAGTYNVTASKQPTHYDNTSMGVVVVPGNITTILLDLAKKPTGNISGVVSSI
ncbi:MAG: hypothetical protein FIB07_12480 [Candidatus Methanoperedens sp.]|nr:hypothetical protein [Candidatus Methanoperedens sp.]